MKNIDQLTKNIERNKKALALIAGLFNFLMIFMAACVAKISRGIALLMVFFWLVLLVCIIVLIKKIKRDEKILKNVELE